MIVRFEQLRLVLPSEDNNLKVAAVIGDIVDSRDSLDRDALQRKFIDILAVVNRRTSPATDLRITRGDEFEGAYASVAAAWEATLRLHLLARQSGFALWISVAWGEVTALAGARDASLQDGPGWWDARTALTQLKETRRAPGNRRTVFADGDPARAATLAAASALRDEVLARLDPSDATIALGLLDRKTQAAVADEMGITPGVVSRRAHRNGLLSLAESARINS